MDNFLVGCVCFALGLILGAALIYIPGPFLEGAEEFCLQVADGHKVVVDSHNNHYCVKGTYYGLDRIVKIDKIWYVQGEKG